MNPIHPLSTAISDAQRDALQARFALRVTAGLSESAAALPLDIGERLRVAREQAVQRAQAARLAPRLAESGLKWGPALALFGGGRDGMQGWWVKLASVLPLLALVFGLVVIQDWHQNDEIMAAAEVDASMLADDLPPSAYGDPGFLEYLRSSE